MKYALLAVTGTSVTLAAMSARADALDDADRRALAYRSGQPVERIDGYVPAAHPGGLSASVPYDQEVIGDGEDLVTGTPRKFCWDTSAIQGNVLSQRLNASDSALAVVRSDDDLQTFMSSVSDVSAGINIGAFASTLRTTVGISTSLGLSTSDLAVIAKFTYLLGSRWYNGNFVLDPSYEALRRSDPAGFLTRCGLGFLSQADNGVSMMIVYHLHKKQEVHATDDEIKSTLSVRYGLSSIDGSETLTDRQKEIISSFEMSSECYMSGGSVSTCDLIRNTSQIEQTWASLTGSFSEDSAVALRTGYMTYAAALSDSKVDIAPERVRLTKLWEARRSWVNSICNLLGYIAADCTSARATIDEVDAAIDDPHSTNLREPDWYDGLPVFLQADLGHVTMYEHIDGGGAQRELHFSANPAASDVYRPGVVYALRDLNFAALISSGSAHFQVPAHWVFELFSSEDGTGASWQLGETGPAILNVPHDFNDQARSFRLRYIP